MSISIISKRATFSPEIIENVSPAMAAAFAKIGQKGLNTKTARALADAHATTPRELAAVVSVLVTAMDEPPGGFADAIAETLWRRAFEHKPLPDSFGFDCGMLVTLAESRAHVAPARFRHLLPLVEAIDRDFENLGAELFGVGHA